jgi:hypothetical protein
MYKISSSALIETKDSLIQQWNRRQDFWDVIPRKLQIGNHVSEEPASSIILKEEAVVSSEVLVPIHQLT